MDASQISRFEAEETELAGVDAARGIAAWENSHDPRALLRTIYGLDNQPIGAFLNTGSLDTAVFGSRHPTIVTIYPFPEEKDLIQAYGVTAKRLESLIAENHVIPLVQFPSRYENLPYLHPILRHRPRNYFVRSVYFYAIFFDGTVELEKNGRLVLAPTLNRLYEKAKQNAILTTILADEHSGVREFYDRLPFGTKVEKETRIKENIWYRYASVASFLSEEVTDYILESHPAQKALGVLLDLHFMFDHAWTQGLLANMHNEVDAHNTDWLWAWSPTRLWWDNAISRVLCADIPCTTLHEPQLDQLEAARSEGYNDVLEKSISEDVFSDLDELQATLRLRIAEIDAKINRIARRGQKTLAYRTIATVLLGFAGTLLPTNNYIGAALGVATGMVLPEAVVKAISTACARVVRTHNVDRHLVAYLSNVWASRPLSGQPIEPPCADRTAAGPSRK